jgi:hypothetical protein
MSEVVPGQGHGGLFVVPGSHKASFRWQPTGQPTSLKDITPETRSLFTELGGKPGTALVFTHNLVHAALNQSERCRRVIHTAYNFGLFSRASWLDDHTDYAALHDAAPPGLWLVSPLLPSMLFLLFLGLAVGASPLIFVSALAPNRST